MLKKIVLVLGLAAASVASVSAIAHSPAPRPAAADTSPVAMKYPPVCPPYQVCY
jgi:hypothetical protein